MGADGLWVRDAKKPEVKKTGWVMEWRSLVLLSNSQGQMVKKCMGSEITGWVQMKMATNSWVDNNNYYVGSNGLWVKMLKPGWTQ